MIFFFLKLADEPRIKISQDVEKVTTPGRKNVYRIYGLDGKAICDLLTRGDEDPPVKGKEIIIQHPFAERQRAKVRPADVRPLYKLYWADGQVQEDLPTLNRIQKYAKDQLGELRKDHVRDLNPTPYKVSFTEKLFNYMHELWTENIPIGELN